MDKVFFATNGTILKANINRSLLTDANIIFTDPALTDYFGRKQMDSLNLDSGLKKECSLKKKITGMMGFDSNFIFQDKLKDGPSFFF